MFLFVSLHIGWNYTNYIVDITTFYTNKSSVESRDFLFLLIAQAPLTPNISAKVELDKTKPYELYHQKKNPFNTFSLIVEGATILNWSIKLEARTNPC